MKTIWDLMPFYVGAIAGVMAVAGWGAWLVISGRWKRRPPQEEDLLRPPGHTLSEKLAAQPAKLVNIGIAVFTGGGLTVASVWALVVWALHLWRSEAVHKLLAEEGFAGLWASRGFAQAAWMLGLFLLGGIGLLMWGRHRFREWLRERHRLTLGLRGEQAVAEELQAAVRAGYHVFHDLPGEKGNIDHVAVGPGGVFAIETKARSKRPLQGQPSDGKTLHRVSFNGRELAFSDGWRETKAVGQAKAIATELSKTLTSATGSRVEVLGVIALPGWWVEHNQFPEVIARNPRLFAKELATAPRTLSDARIAAIVHQLAQRCRDVSFEMELG